MSSDERKKEYAKNYYLTVTKVKRGHGDSVGRPKKYISDEEKRKAISKMNCVCQYKRKVKENPLYCIGRELETTAKENDIIVQPWMRQKILDMFVSMSVANEAISAVAKL